MKNKKMTRMIKLRRMNKLKRLSNRPRILSGKLEGLRNKLMRMKINLMIGNKKTL